MTNSRVSSPGSIVQNNEARAGFLFALGAYGLWGMLPLYLKLVGHVSAIEVTAHRAFWALPIAAAIVLWLGRTGDLITLGKTPKKLMILLLCAGLISINWGVYVWAVSVERTLEGALGYYINPLFSVALGAIFLGERFNRAQALAIFLALIAVAILTIAGGGLPWVSLVLALSFTAYGYLRKTIEFGPTQGFLVEVMFLSVIALPSIIWLEASGQGKMLTGWENFFLLVGCGPVTAIPLILFAAGAKRLRLATLGLMQYIAPTLIFLISVFVFGEPFGTVKLIAFCLIWTALAIYTFSSFAKRS